MGCGMTRDCFYVLSKYCRNPATRQFSICAYMENAQYYHPDKHVCEDHVDALKETYRGYTLTEIKSKYPNE